LFHVEQFCPGGEGKADGLRRKIKTYKQKRQKTPSGAFSVATVTLLRCHSWVSLSEWQRVVDSQPTISGTTTGYKGASSVILKSELHYVKNSEIATEAKPRPSRWLFETRGLNDAYYGQSGLARMLEFFPALLSWFFQSFLLVLMPASCYAKFMMGLLMPPEAVQNN